jgi:hypothetical protein
MKQRKIYGVFKALITLIFLVIFLSLIGVCGTSQDALYPSDQSLIDLFKANQANFANLQSDPDNKEIRSLLGIKFAEKGTTGIRFAIWVHASPPGGAYKGFAYLEQTLPPHLLVDSIDKKTDPPISPEEKHMYRHIQGKWYLYYYSIH